MAQAEIHEVVDVDQGKLFATILDYENYPKFVDGCKSIKVDRKGAGRTLVTYNVSMIKDITYTLELTENAAAGRVDWKLIESDTIKKNSGTWLLKSAGPGKTDVTYSIEIDFKIPVPGLILNKLVKGSLPAMVKSFVKQAKKS